MTGALSEESRRGDGAGDEGETPPGQPAGGSTADWLWALLLITAIIAVVIVLFLFGIGAFCDCTTRPAA